MTPAEARAGVAVLRDARALIADKSRWCQEFYAMDKLGADVTPDDHAAVCWCSVGAIQKAGKHSGDAFYALLLLENEIAETLPITIVEFNDSYSHSDVMALFDRTIANATEKSGPGGTA